MSAKGVELIELERLVPSGTNPRKRFDAAKLEELAGTIREHGILEPLLVRRSPEVPGCFEIIAGERRYRAAGLAGLGEAPCVVKELTDQQVLEVQYIENLQREDLTALEEAEGFARLIESGGYTAETLAAKLGKSRSHIFNRLRLCRLEGPVREAVEDGRLNQVLALELAKVPGCHQEEALKRVLDGEYGDNGPMSVREARRFISREFMCDLKEALWGLEDRKLVKEAGACAVCPKRIGNMDPATVQELYPDLAEKKSANVCTDLECYQGKRKAWRLKMLAEAAKEGPVLTLEECDEAYPRGEWLDHKSDYVERLESWWVRELGKQANELLPKPKAARYGAVTPGGVVKQLWRKSELLAEMQAMGIHVPSEEESESESRGGETAEEKAKREAAWKAQQEKEERERQLRKVVDARLGEMVLERLEEPTGAAVRARWLLVLYSMGHGDLPWPALKKFQLKEGDFYTWGKLLKAVGKWHHEKLQKLAMALVAFDPYADEDEAGFATEFVDFGCELLGIDRKKIEKEVKGSAKEKEEEGKKGRTNHEGHEEEETTTKGKKGKKAKGGKKEKKVLSEAARKRIAEAARKRWMLAKKGGNRA